MPAYPPRSMLVVSPTIVAAPCKLEETAMAINTGTGDIFSFLDMASPTGATIRTVATLSTKALIIPANNARTVTAHFTFGTLDINISARRAGILLSINSVTIPMVPPIIKRTL